MAKATKPKLAIPSIGGPTWNPPTQPATLSNVPEGDWWLEGMSNPAWSAPNMGFAGPFLGEFAFPTTDPTGDWDVFKPGAAGTTGSEGYFYKGPAADQESAWLSNIRSITGPESPLLGSYYDTQAVGATTATNVWGTGAQGPWAPGALPWEQLTFKGGYLAGDYNANIQANFEAYRDNVSLMFDKYYGTGAGAYWRGTGTGEGGAMTAADWVPQITDAAGDPQWDVWDRPGEYDPASVAPGTDWNLPKYYQEYNRAFRDLGTPGTVDDPKQDYAGMYQFGLDESGENVYTMLRDPLFEASADTGTKVKEYFNSRQATMDKYFGLDVDMPAGWDPADPYTGLTPTITDPNDSTKEITISETSTTDELAKAKTKYGNSAMGLYISKLQDIKGDIESMGPLDEGKYAGLYAGQDTLLKGLFGSKTLDDPAAGSRLANSRAKMKSIANKFHTDPLFGESALQTAIGKSSGDQASAMETYENAIEGASQGFFGVTDFDRDMLVSLGFMDSNYNLQFDSTPGTALGTDADPVLENESELAYKLRMLSGSTYTDADGNEQTLSVSKETGNLNVYDEAYERNKKSKVDTMEKTHENFQTQMESTMSDFAKGEKELKEGVAKQKGIRTGAQERLSEMLATGMIETVGISKEDWEEQDEITQENFDEEVQNISTNLVDAWNLAWGAQGTAETAEDMQESALGGIFGEYTDSTGETRAFTEAEIKEVLKADLGIGDSYTFADTTKGTGTITDIGDYGLAVEGYKDVKMATFGDVDKTAGYDPGKEGWGSGDESYYDPNHAEADDYGWVTTTLGKPAAGAPPTADTDIGEYGGLEMPKGVMDDLAKYPISGMYGAEGQTSEYLDKYYEAFETYGKPTGFEGLSEGYTYTQEDIDAGTDAEGQPVIEGAAVGDKRDVVSTMQEQWGAVTGGEFGRKKTEAVADIEDYKSYALPGAKTEAFGDMDTDFGRMGEQNEINAFTELATNAEIATVGQWQSMWEKTQADSIPKQLESLGRSVTQDASLYMQNLIPKLAGPGFEKLLSPQLYGQHWTAEGLATIPQPDEPSWWEKNMGWIIPTATIIVLAIIGKDDEKGCFVAGTKVKMQDGTEKNIEDVKINDIVKTFNMETNSIETSNVTETYTHKNNTNGLLINNIIKTTTNHPFYLNGDWVEAGKLNIGDKILHVDGMKHTITSLKLIEDPTTVYNFEVDGTHSYFAEGYLVHNK